jgi:pimeloyl-ACP methyl ester carboxylesterase
MTVSRIETPILDIAYEAAGPDDGMPVLLLHGWPDDVRTYDGVAGTLNEAGFRTYAPWLRGYGETRFRSAGSMRSGQISAMAQDALDFIDALGIERLAVLGHDWGARIGYVLASLYPERITRLAALSVGWRPGELATPPLGQARAFWYQWFMATERGAEFVRKNGKVFARNQWDTWSPAGWFDDATFERTATSFENPDWVAITLHSYRVRWGEAEPDPTYADIERRSKTVTEITVPTLMIQGGDDRCVLPQSTEGAGPFFTGGYRRAVLDGVGHFPTREAPTEVAPLLLEFLRGG